MAFRCCTPVRKADPTPDRPSLTERQVAQAFLEAVNALSNTVDAAVVLRLIGQGVTQAMSAVGFGEFVTALTPVVGAVSQEVIDGGIAGVDALPDGIKGAYSFDRLDPRAAAWAQQRAAELVREVTDQQRQILRDVLTRSVENGWTVNRTADELRNVTGLTQRWAQAVQNTWDREFASAVKDGLNEQAAIARANRTAKVHRDRLMDARARNIARTEIQTAQNQGRWLSWAQGVEGGYIAPGAKKRWLTGPLSTKGPNRKQVCDVCAGLRNEEVLWDKPFSNGRMMPPGHPSCRCTSVLVPPKVEDKPVADGGPGWEDGGTFAGDRCSLCPGNCHRRIPVADGQLVKAASACSGLPSAAPPHAVPVKKASECSVGDVLFIDGQDKGFEVIGPGNTPGELVLQGAKSKIKYQLDAATAKGKKAAVVPGPAKADKALAEWKASVSPGAKPVKHAPPGAKPIAKADECHPGDVLYFGSDKTKKGWNVLGQDAPTGKLAVSDPVTGKKYLLDANGQATKVGYAIVPGQQKGWHLLNQPGGGASKPPVSVPTQTGKAPSWSWKPQPGAITGHSAYPGNSYGIVGKVPGKPNYWQIVTKDGTKFEAPEGSLIGIVPGTKIKWDGLSTDVVDTRVSGGKLWVKDTDGDWLDTTSGKLGPNTATPGQGAAAGMGSSSSSRATGNVPEHPKAKDVGDKDFTQFPGGVQWGTKAHDRWRSSLTRDEQRALADYTGAGYRSMNRQLRNDGRLPPGAETPEIRAARQALEKAVIPEDIIVLRGISAPGYDALGVGDLIHDAGFQSTAVGSTGFGNGTYLRIHVPQGSRGAYLGQGDHSSFGDSERELLLPPGSTMEVLSVTTSGGTTYVDVTLIAQGNPPPSVPIARFAKRLWLMQVDDSLTRA